MDNDRGFAPSPRGREGKGRAEDNDRGIAPSPEGREGKGRKTRGGSGERRSPGCCPYGHYFGDLQTS